MQDDPSTTPRRAFMSSVASIGTVIGLSGLASAAHAAEAGGAAAEPATGFAKWLDSIGGKYRQVFDAPESNEGMPLIFPFVFLLTGPKAYGVPDQDLGVVIVLRHKAIPIALTDAMWSKYRLGEEFGIKDPASNAPSTRNFFAHSKPGDLVVPDASIDRLMARGVKVGVCGMAIMHFSGTVAKRMGMPQEEVEKDWIAGLVPGATVVPSGVVAVNGAQARGCTYCFAG